MKTSVKVSCVHDTPPLSFHYKAILGKNWIVSLSNVMEIFRKRLEIQMQSVGLERKRGIGGKKIRLCEQSRLPL